MKEFEKEMKKCLRLAQKAAGKTSPNPMVGCIVLDKKGEIISTGYHTKYGEFHAERNALNKIRKNEGHTMIVNLEPCCHYGKTPPCTEIIIEKGIKKVVYGMKDPNPQVSGMGLEILKNAGIEIFGPVLEKECQNLNEIFIKNKIYNKIFVALKIATTIDGKIATSTGDSKWITSEKARNEGKKLRKYYDAILTSSATVLNDNPEMKHKNKIILDRKLKTNPNSKIYQQGNVYVFCEKCPKDNDRKNIHYIKTPIISEKLNINFILNKIFELGIMSIFVEAGGNLCGSFLPYTDKLYHFTAPKIISDTSAISCFEGYGIQKIDDCFKFKLQSSKSYYPDILNTYVKL